MDGNVFTSPSPQHPNFDAQISTSSNEPASRRKSATPTAFDTSKGQAPQYRYHPTPPGSEVDPDSPPVSRENSMQYIKMASIAESPVQNREDLSVATACPPAPPQLSSTTSSTTSSSGFKCQFCPKTFRKRSLLAAHERIHQNLRPFKCDQCPKDFRDFGALSSHKIRLHSREFLKFNCKICTKRFRYERELEIHQRMHTGSKPYFCGFCNKSFTQLGNQRSHVRRHFVRHGFVKFPTENNAFAAKCVLCHRTFNDGVSMEAHTKCHISDKDVAALKEKTTNVLWTTSDTSKVSTKSVSRPTPAPKSVEVAKENVVNQRTAALPTLSVPQLMNAKGASPSKVNDFQAAFTLAALLGGGQPKEAVPMEGPPKGLPFSDVNGVPPHMANSPMVFPVANHGGASGYYVYVPGPAVDAAAMAAVNVATKAAANSAGLANEK